MRIERRHGVVCILHRWRHRRLSCIIIEGHAVMLSSGLACSAHLDRHSAGQRMVYASPSIAGAAIAAVSRRPSTRVHALGRQAAGPRSPRQKS